MDLKTLKQKSTNDQLIEAISMIAALFILAAFVRLAWNAIADVASLPTFSYWEYFSFTIVFNSFARTLKGIFGHS